MAKRREGMKTVEKGVSMYVGLGYTLKDIRDYLHSARQYGYSSLFTSLHIPEADRTKIVHDFTSMVNYAKQIGFRVTADISPKAFEILGISPGNMEALARLGVDTLRLDFGFNLDETVHLAIESGLEIELNASVVDARVLHSVLNSGIDPCRLRACHNFYPRPETGLSYELFAERSQLFRNFGIPVAAFIPSRKNPRGPIYEGLPTLEQHRSLPSLVAAKHFLACKLVDGIFFGDSFASSEELVKVSELDEGCLELSIDIQDDISDMEKTILLSRHTNRLDPGESVIRSQEARNLCQGVIPKRCSMLPRTRGMITVDNVDYLRYMGELQVVCRDLPANDRVNAVARVRSEELFLLEYLYPGCSFCFKES